MNYFDFWRSSSLISRSVLVIVLAHLVVGVGVHAYWMNTGHEQALRAYFDYEGVPLFLLLGGLQATFAILVFRDFSSRSPLGSAWRYIMLASICYFAGTVLKQWLAANTEINPALYRPFEVTEQTRILFGMVGTVLGGPIMMVLLGSGLYMAIRTYRQLGMLGKLKAVDLMLIGASLIYAVVVICGVVLAVRSHPEGVTAQQALTWPGDYLLSILLIEAVFLRRASVEAGWGYVSRIWGAFVAGIFITSFCSLMNWLTAYGILTWTQTAFVWYLWYPAAAAFALAPTFQWEAMRTARLRLSKPVEELGLPALPGR